jgi:FlaA1/EpsC-like NDP-sugar epimerase
MFTLHHTGNLKRAMKMMTLLTLVCAANLSAFWLRFDGDIPQWALDLAAKTLPVLVAVRLATFIPFKLYDTVWQYTGLWDLLNLVRATVVGTLLFIIAVRVGLGYVQYPRSIFLIDALLLIVFTTAVWVIRRAGYPRSSADMKTVLIYGAGQAGERLARDLRHNWRYGYRPVGFVDDDPRKAGQRIHGVKVLGTREQLPAIMRACSPNTVMIAMPSARGVAIRDIAKLLLGYNVSIKILPDLNCLLDGTSEVNQLRNLSVEDLLHRPRVGLERTWAASLLKGRRILVTGAGGSIGSELCRQIASHEPDALILYERYENSLFAIHGELCGGPACAKVYPVIGDVTDRARLLSTMGAYEPEVVFHAAAHKHVPLMEFNPCEAVKNNVVGTRTVATLAHELGVQRFIMISTDKAVRPSSVMGATKRIAELIIQDMARVSRTTFATVRFGNVLGSNGSVVPHFLQQIKAGGPVTVTHPDVERYFMLIPEAVELVLHAAALADQGSIYVLEMGRQVKLQELARHLIRLSGFVPGREISITFTGLRPGEKLSEELVGPDETVMPSALKEIVKVRSNHVPAHDALVSALADLERVAYLHRAEEVLAAMNVLVPSFQATSRHAILAVERVAA